MASREPARAPSVIGVLGAGTMGAGIAQLACQSGARTLVCDPDPAALERGLERIRHRLRREAERGRRSPEQAEAAVARLQPVAELGALAECELVIEAAPERLELKRELFAALSEVVGADCVLATNTSSLSVTAIASAARAPERVVGMHFFNPPPVMAALEVVAGLQSSARAVATAQAAGRAMGKTVIDAVDGPGFLINRCNRPFGLEGLELLAEQVAPVAEIDRACRLAGFPMGPFELMDLVGVDVALDVARSFHEQSFGEPRWRPSPIAVPMVAAGRLGRKAGRGFYDYHEGRGHRPADPPAPEPGGGDGLVVVAGRSPLAEELSAAAAGAGWEVSGPAEAAGGPVPELVLDCTGGEEELEAPLQGGPRAICLTGGSLAALDPGGSAVGFHLLVPLQATAVVELARGPDTAESAAVAAERFFATLGKHALWVADAPGLVVGRIVCQLVNEAAFALGAGIGTAGDIDAGLVAGLNHPRGILSWADAIGLDQVLIVLDALAAERSPERYRAAPALRRLVWSGRLGRQTGEGFFRHEP